MVDLKIVTSVLVAIFGVVAYWNLVGANPVSSLLNNPQIYQVLSSHASTNSNEEASREEDLAEASGEKSREVTSAEDDNEEDDTAEIKVFSAKVVQVDNQNGTLSAVVSNIQKWETQANKTVGDQTVMYFLDDRGDVELSNVTEVKVLAGATLPCNNKKHQFFIESDRCNGLYQCDENGEDERNCPDKCRGFRYPDQVELADCRAYFPRYYFDSQTGRCQFFIYGGCANVVNMFLSKTECERECAFLVPSSTTTETSTTGTLETETTVLAIAPAQVKVIDETVTKMVPEIVDVTEALTTPKVDSATETIPESSGDALIVEQAPTNVLAAEPVDA